VSEAPRISIGNGSPSSEEAAAVAAAIGMLAAGRANASGGEAPAESGWARAALREGVEARRLVADVWGTSPPRPGELPLSRARGIG